jgi:hypothetical protein
MHEKMMGLLSKESATQRIAQIKENINQAKGIDRGNAGGEESSGMAHEKVANNGSYEKLRDDMKKSGLGMSEGKVYSKEEYESMKTKFNDAVKTMGGLNGKPQIGNWEKKSGVSYKTIQDLKPYFS